MLSASLQTLIKAFWKGPLDTSLFKKGRREGGWGLQWLVGKTGLERSSGREGRAGMDRRSAYGSVELTQLQKLTEA